MPHSAHVAEVKVGQGLEGPGINFVILLGLLQSPAETWACHDKETGMPRHQSTAAKKARTAARQGAKYTAALREEYVDNELYGPAQAAVRYAADQFDGRVAALDGIGRVGEHLASMQRAADEHARQVAQLSRPSVVEGHRAAIQRGLDERDKMIAALDRIGMVGKQISAMQHAVDSINMLTVWFKPPA